MVFIALYAALGLSFLTATGVLLRAPRSGLNQKYAATLYCFGFWAFATIMWWRQDHPGLGPFDWLQIATVANVVTVAAALIWSYHYPRATHVGGYQELVSAVAAGAIALLILLGPVFWVVHPRPGESPPFFLEPKPAFLVYAAWTAGAPWYAAYLLWRKLRSAREEKERLQIKIALAGCVSALIGVNVLGVFSPLGHQEVLPWLPVVIGLTSVAATAYSVVRFKSLPIDEVLESIRRFSATRRVILRGMLLSALLLAALLPITGTLVGVQGAEEWTRYTLYTLLALALAILPIALSLIRTISGPLGELTEASLELSRGDLSRRVDIRSDDDIGLLADAFNRMAASIQDSFGKLRDAERTLRESEARFRGLAALAPVGIFRTDERGVCTYVNERWSSITGLAREASAGEEWTAAVFGGAGGEASAGWRERAERSEGFSFERPIVRGDGSIVFVLGAVRAERSEAGRTAGFVGVLADIGERVRAEEERRRLEDQLQQAQRLESLGVMAGGIAHDFNNVLQSILTNAALCLSEIESDSPAFEKACRIEEDALRASSLVHGILTYSGDRPAKRLPLRLQDEVRRSMKMLRPLVRRGVRLEVECEDDPPLVEADSAQMWQVVTNLVLNAAEAVGEREGRIAVRVYRCDVDERRARRAVSDPPLAPGGYVALEVSDDGCGMDAETASRMFDPFFSTKQREGGRGRGLGMASVYGIMRAHGGGLEVESEVGKGATVRALLPASDKMKEGLVIPFPGRRAAESSGTILIVEDEAGIREATAELLEGEGFRVLSAETGREGLRLYEEHGSEIDLTLLDVRLPDVGGVEVLRAMRRLRPTARVILVSGNLTFELRSQLGGLDAIELVDKPCPPPDLLNKIRRALQLS